MKIWLELCPFSALGIFTAIRDIVNKISGKYVEYSLCPRCTWSDQNLTLFFVNISLELCPFSNFDICWNWNEILGKVFELGFGHLAYCLVLRYRWLDRLLYKIWQFLTKLWLLLVTLVIVGIFFLSVIHVLFRGKHMVGGSVFYKHNF